MNLASRLLRRNVNVVEERHSLKGRPCTAQSPVSARTIVTLQHVESARHVANSSCAQPHTLRALFSYQHKAGLSAGPGVLVIWNSPSLMIPDDQRSPPTDHLGTSKCKAVAGTVRELPLTKQHPLHF